MAARTHSLSLLTAAQCGPSALVSVGGREAGRDEGRQAGREGGRKEGRQAGK